MDVFQISAVLLSIAALLSYLNHRFVHLPTAIGLMSISLAVSLLLIATAKLFPGGREWARFLLAQIDFGDALLHGMLSALLFAGALHVDLEGLLRQYRIILGLATVGVILSTWISGFLFYQLLILLGHPLALIDCLLFGALISPTDPVAVLGILKNAKAPRSLEMKITGESLFNDGIGVVIFLVISTLAAGGEYSGHTEVGPAMVGLLFLQEVAGGSVLGLGLGFLCYRMLRSIDNYQVEVLLTLALVTGGYALVEALHCSAPIAMVVAGLLIGNQGRSFAMSAVTREHLDTFWELVDEILNGVLFVLIGLEVLALSFGRLELMAALLAIPIVLLSRFVSVGLAVHLLRPFRAFSPHVVKILTWAGLRGGISVALSLSLPAGPAREIIVTATYAVVVFSILVQGLTIGPLIRWAIQD